MLLCTCSLKYGMSVLNEEGKWMKGVGLPVSNHDPYCQLHKIIRGFNRAIFKTEDKK